MAKYFAVWLKLVLGIFFAQTGLFKIYAPTLEQIEGLAGLGYPDWMLTALGGAEFLGGVGMLIGMFVAPVAGVAGIWLALVIGLTLFSGVNPISILLLMASLLVTRLHLDLTLDWFAKQRQRFTQK